MSEKSFKEKFGKHLGQVGSYAIHTDKHDSSLLVPIPRTENRNPLGIKPEELWVEGVDVWNCHEATFLLETGEPVAGTLKLTYGSSSPNIIESKSLKLYTNSWDMERIPGTRKEAIKYYERTIQRELSEVTGTVVQVKLFTMLHERNLSQSERELLKVSDYGSVLYLSEGVITDYKGESNHLEFYSKDDIGNGVEENELQGQLEVYTTNVLRSRCHITSQKDTGTAVIHIKAKNGYKIKQSSLLKQIVSLRDMTEFHENCAEKLFKDIMETGKVEQLSVLLLYSRRGSWDINPWRSNIKWEKYTSQLEKACIESLTHFLDIDKLSIKEMGQ